METATDGLRKQVLKVKKADEDRATLASWTTESPEAKRSSNIARLGGARRHPRSAVG